MVNFIFFVSVTVNGKYMLQTVIPQLSRITIQSSECLAVNLCMVIAAALNTRDIHCRSLSMSAVLPLPRLLKVVERTLNK